MPMYIKDGNLNWITNYLFNVHGKYRKRKYTEGRFGDILIKHYVALSVLVKSLARTTENVCNVYVCTQNANNEICEHKYFL